MNRVSLHSCNLVSLHAHILLKKCWIVTLRNCGNKKYFLQLISISQAKITPELQLKIPEELKSWKTRLDGSRAETESKWGGIAVLANCWWCNPRDVTVFSQRLLQIRCKIDCNWKSLLPTASTNTTTLWRYLDKSHKVLYNELKQHPRKQQFMVIFNVKFFLKCTFKKSEICKPEGIGF